MRAGRRRAVLGLVLGVALWQGVDLAATAGIRASEPRPHRSSAIGRPVTPAIVGSITAIPGISRPSEINAQAPVSEQTATPALPPLPEVLPSSLAPISNLISCLRGATDPHALSDCTGGVDFVPPVLLPPPVGPPLSDQNQSASLLLVPPSGPPGTTIRAVGFCPPVSYGHQDGDHALTQIDLGAGASVVTAGAGHFVATLTVPDDAPPGEIFEVTLACRYKSLKPEFEIIREFLVTSGEPGEAGGMMVVPGSGPPGTLVSVVGKCPAPSASGEELSDVTVSINRVPNQPTLSALFRSDGKFAVTLAIPDGAQPTTATVKASCFYGAAESAEFVFQHEFRVTGV